MDKNTFLLSTVIVLLAFIVIRGELKTDKAFAQETGTNGIITMNADPNFDKFIVIDTENKAIALYKIKNESEMLLMGARKFDVDMQIPGDYSSKKGLRYKEVESAIKKLNK